MVAAVAVLANRLEIPAAILLVLAGVVLALIPGLPAVELSPQVVLHLVFAAGRLLFRGLYELARVSVQSAANFDACRGLRSCSRQRASRRQPIGCLDLRGHSASCWARIDSPPDTMAPLSIARRLNIPRRIRVILEGEGLANDATALILYRFAVGAVSTGLFSLRQAAATFSAIVAGEIVWGIGVGGHAAPATLGHDPRVEITLSILDARVGLLGAPKNLGGSGVLATVTSRALRQLEWPLAH